MKGALEGEDAEPLGAAIHVMIAPRRLDGAFERFRAGIGEENLVGETVGDQSLAQSALPGNLVEVRDMPKLAGLLGQRGDQMRMAVAKRVDRDAGGEIEISLALARQKPNAFAPVECQGSACECLVKCRTAHFTVSEGGDPVPGPWGPLQSARREIKKAAPKDGLSTLYQGFVAGCQRERECRSARKLVLQHGYSTPGQAGENPKKRFAPPGRLLSRSPSIR